MKRRLLLLTALMALGVPAAGLATTSSAPTVKLRMTSRGKILVNSKGFTLYVFTHDAKTNEDTCVQVKGCTGTWPPYTVKSKPTAGSGVNQMLLGTITLPNGKKQVTYNGHALYLYHFATGPRQTSYVGVFEFGGYWYAMNAKGHEVT